ncbi:hypothetical protein BDN70DRAFT_989820 [Pholiota conissans]|uniref:Uncharacterized protein n=1 Tax=Pholiota conissans TaxID=109636 RepID=A0A9P5ZC60_9AGAR|nr:hypothetical protein BDN70DRAFT_989820 [Pholiota conissans]
MRWTYKLLIVLHLLLSVHSIALSAPASSSIGRTDQLLKREPVPADRASTSKPPSPRRSRRRQRSCSPSGASPRKRPKRQQSPGPEAPTDGGTRITSPHGSQQGGPSPKKKRRGVKHPKSNIRAEQLKLPSKEYREIALKHAPPGNYKSTHDADHLVEPQTVTYYLNNHRGQKKVNARCIEALKVPLNSPDNLRMLKIKHNANKRTIVGRLNQNHSKDVDRFDSEVEGYILQNTANIRKTGRAVDELFKDGQPCQDYRKAGDESGGILHASEPSFHRIPSKVAAKAFSPTAWRIRYILNMRNIPHETERIELPDIENHWKKLVFGPHLSNPMIAEYFEKTCSGTSSIFPHDTHGLQWPLANLFVITALPALWQFIVPSVYKKINPAGEAYFRATREMFFQSAFGGAHANGCSRRGGVVQASRGYG